MKNPIQMCIGTLHSTAVDVVAQEIEVVEEEDKNALVCVPLV
jgi:hypothetical protein